MTLNQASSPPMAPERALPWYQVWLKALTSPNVVTYESFVTRPGVSVGKACLWVFLGATVGYAIAAAIRLALGALGTIGQRGPGPMSNLAGSGLLLVCLVPVAGALSVVALIIVSGFSHILASALGGNGTYAQLAYAMAAYTAPASLVTSALSAVPVVGGCLGLPLGLYLIFLNVLAIKAVHHLTWARAILSSAIFFVGLLVVLACFTIVALALLGPAIGNVFSNIVIGI